jgi:hypothetical protein
MKTLVRFTVVAVVVIASFGQVDATCRTQCTNLRFNGYIEDDGIICCKPDGTTFQGNCHVEWGKEAFECVLRQTRWDEDATCLLHGDIADKGFECSDNQEIDIARREWESCGENPDCNYTDWEEDTVQDNKCQPCP